MFKPFTLFDLPESYPLNEHERSRIFRYVDRYAETMEGAWLHALNYRAITLKWCCGMTQENGIMGCFAAMTDTIYLQPEDVYEAVPGVGMGRAHGADSDSRTASRLAVAVESAEVSVLRDSRAAGNHARAGRQGN